MKKSDYYLKYARAVYQWQKDHLLRTDGVYFDMMGVCEPDCDISYEKIDGKSYRKHNDLRQAVGKPYSYNSGTMLSGAADLFKATGDSLYIEDLKSLNRASFSYFASKDKDVDGYYSYNSRGFSVWFNDVLMRAYADTYPMDDYAAFCISTFQKNLDYAYKNYLYKGMLPVNLLTGWDKDPEKNKIEVMFTFSYASEYAVLARFELEK